MKIVFYADGTFYGIVNDGFIIEEYDFIAVPIGDIIDMHEAFEELYQNIKKADEEMEDE